MRERGIIFNAEMVRAVLEGRKTQTRRIIKNQRVGDNWSVQPAKNPRIPGHTHDWWLPTATKPYSALPRCPYGAVGDRLWVRESSYAAELKPSGLSAVIYTADNALRLAEGDESVKAKWQKLFDYRGGTGLQVPSIHMPRWASRITLEITGVRVEHLQDISESDAVAEGIEPLPLEPDMPQFYHEYFPIGIKNGLRCNMSAASSFSGLWEAIYGKESWQANPWVWVIEFKRVDGE